MGTRTGWFVLLFAVMALALSSLAWADAAPEEVVALPAPALAPAVIAQAADAPAPDPAPETLGVTQNTDGIVYYYNDRDWEVWISLGDLNGLRPTAQVEFVRDGQVVGTGVVKRVRDCDAIVTPSSDTPGGAILKGDDVRVVTNGTRAALDKQLVRERRWQMLGEILFGALVWLPYNK